jgi:uncharacterized protein YkwD
MPRRRSVAVAVVGATAAPLAAVPDVVLPETAHARSVHDRLERAIAREINQVRARQGLRAVRSSRSLARAAARHSGDQLGHDQVTHTSSDGTPFQRRIRRYTRGSAGEVIAWVDRGTARRAQTIVQLWLGSPSHRAQLMTSSFRRVGIGAGNGMLGARPGTIVTADFASRR